jgi:hypothetical protein
MKASWKDIDYPAEAGKYHFRDGEVLVEPRHLDIWNEYPNAVFVVRAAPAFSGVRYMLGGYEIARRALIGAAGSLPGRTVRWCIMCRRGFLYWQSR